MTSEEQQAFGQVEEFARERGIGLLEALAILRLVLQLKDLPQVQELLDKIKEAFSD